MPIHRLLLQRPEVVELDARIARAEAAERRPAEDYQAARLTWGDRLAHAVEGDDPMPEPPAAPRPELLEQLHRITIALRDARLRLLVQRNREILLDLQAREQEILDEVRAISDRLAELGPEACDLGHAAAELDRAGNLPPGTRRHFYGTLDPAGVLRHVAAGNGWIAP